MQAVGALHARKSSCTHTNHGIRICRGLFQTVCACSLLQPALATRTSWLAVLLGPPPIAQHALAMAGLQTPPQTSQERHASAPMAPARCRTPRWPLATWRASSPTALQERLLLLAPRGASRVGATTSTTLQAQATAQHVSIRPWCSRRCNT
jgi:hypothetical protein